jgi:hypothetical protein
MKGRHLILEHFPLRGWSVVLIGIRVLTFDGVKFSTDSAHVSREILRDHYCSPMSQWGGKLVKPRQAVLLR